MNETSDGHWFSSVDGLSLFYRTISGPARRARIPLLCLHDLTQTSHVFDTPASDIASSRPVILPDLRGHGRSDYALDLSSYCLRMFASDLFHLMEAERLRHVALIGIGLGGLIALELAAELPDHITALILVESGPEFDIAALSDLTHDIGAPDWDECVVRPLLADLIAADGWALFDKAKSKPMLAVRGATSRFISAETFSEMAWRKPDLTRASFAQAEECRRLSSAEVIEAIRSFLNTCP